MSSRSSEDRARSPSEPPPGDPWDVPIARAPFAFVDLEFTGLEPARDRVVQICVERVEGDELTRRLSSFVRPQPWRESAAASALHGIGREQLEAAPEFADVAAELLEVLDGSILVAHAARHDVAFLVAELSRLGRAWSCPHYLDTLALSRRALAVQSHRLSALAEALDIDNPRAHRADNDVSVLRGLFAHLLKALTPASARDLWHVARARRIVRPEVVAAAKRAADRQQLARVHYRPCGRPAEQLGFHVTSVRTDLYPPVVLGYLQHTRGRRELRADRILTLELVGDDSVDTQID